MKKAIRYSPLLLMVISILQFNQQASAGIGVERTFVLQKNQIPTELRKFNPTQLYLLYSGGLSCYSTQNILRKDTIINFKIFLDSLKCGDISYRLIFQKGEKIDSVLQLNNSFKITDKAFNLNNNLLRLISFDDAGRQIDEFIFDYGQKYKQRGLTIPSLNELMRLYTVYTYADKQQYTKQAVWILSVGVNDYSDIRFRNCESDATALTTFFNKQYTANFISLPDEMVHNYLLLGKAATKDAILNALKDIAAKAAANDYFIFNFSGFSWPMSSDSVTYFFPHNVSNLSINFQSGSATIQNRNKNDTNSVLTNLISLKALQEHIQLIPCTNQLFISEAGPSEKFKTEFVKTMMQNSPEIASLLNVNRIIIVPNEIGLDDLNGIGKGPITHYITSLPVGLNIYDLFASDYKAEKIAYQLKSAEYKNQAKQGDDYFSVFFERKFLQQYREIFGDFKSKKRGLDLGETELRDISSFSGNRHALIIGTDHYKAKDWDKLDNPVYDATEVAEVLNNVYGYEVNLLKDPPMDTFYNAISNYYKNLKENDQLIIYIAGHGDFDAGLLDDGFIVCADSKSPQIDPLRNTYIQHTKLKKMINKIPAKQILVLLDICHGGVFDDAVLGKQRDNPAAAITNRNVLELLKDKAQYTTRKVLSSVGKESAFDGNAGKHSPFAAYLLKILNARGGTEAIVTLSDIYALLQKASLNETATLKISPHIAGFGENDPLSEFILIPASPNK